MRRAKASFTANFFGCAGYEIIDNAGFKIIEDGVIAAYDEIFRSENFNSFRPFSRSMLWDDCKQGSSLKLFSQNGHARIYGKPILLHSRLRILYYLQYFL